MHHLGIASPSSRTAKLPYRLAIWRARMLCRTQLLTRG
jgi:hypothetical protein